jgi:hypothetical protein
VKGVSPLWLLAGFPLYFAALWCGIIFLLSRVGGWHRLAQSFQATSQPTGRKFSMASASLGGTNYNNCLTTVVANEGFFMQPWLPFRMFHPPLLIPWNAFSPFQERKLLWSKLYTTAISTRDGRQLKLTLSSQPMVTEMGEKMINTAVERSDTPWSN